MGFEFDRFEKRRGQKDDRKSKAVKSIFKVKKKKHSGRWSLIFVLLLALILEPI